MLTAEQFKFHLARYAKVKEEDAAAFMDAITKTLLEKVQAGEEVCIQGLGTFVVIDSQQGRRLGFQVDEKMRKQVNAPFACFEPMVLAAEMKKNTPVPSVVVGKPEDLEREDVQESVLDQEPALALDPTPNDESVADELESVEEPVSEENPVQMEDAVEVSLPVQEQLSAPVEESMSTSAEESESGSEGKEPAEPATEPVVEGKSSEAAPETQESQESVAVPLVTEPSTQKEEKKPAQVRRRYEEPSLVDQIKSLYEKIREKQIKPWVWASIAGGILLLIVIIICLCASSGKKTTPSPVQPVETETTTDSIDQAEETQKEEVIVSDDSNSVVVQSETLVSTTSNSTKKAEESIKTASKSNKVDKHHITTSGPTANGKKPTDEMILHENGVPKKASLGDGGRLTLVALRNYGDKAFWAYIYDVNAYQLGNPNNVPIGLPLYLPDPTYYGIDASDPTSVKKAQNRAMQILNAWK